MKRFILIFLLFTVFVNAELKVGRKFSFPSSLDNYNIARTVKNIWQIKNESSELVRDITFSIYVPVSQTSHQFLKYLQTSQTGELYKDDLGNQIFTVSIKQIAPYSSFILRVQSNLLLSSTAISHKTTATKKFLGPEKFIETNKQEIVAIAKKLAAKSSKDSAEKTFKWLTSNLKKGRYTSDALGALYALKKKQGDCTEFSFAMTALLRANKIPARLVSGYPVLKNQILKARMYHNWVEYFDTDKWQISDPFNNNHSSRKEQFIAFKINGGDAETQMKGQYRYFISNQLLKVSMDY